MTFSGDRYPYKLPLPDNPEDQAKLSVNQTAERLAVSPATVRNWMKAGILKSERLHGRVVIDGHAVTRLRQRIENDAGGRLKSRRNKTAKKGNCVPLHYVADSRYSKLAAEILRIASSMRSEHRTELILSELALSLLCAAHKITATGARLGTHIDLLESGGYCGDGVAIVRELLPSRIRRTEQDNQLLASLSELEVPLVPGEDILGLVYMSLQNLDARKAEGSYYTPASVVSQLVEQHLLDGQGDSFKVADLCCGSGNFLIRAFQRMRALLTQQGYSSLEAERCAMGALHGYDIDGRAIALSHINLLLATRHKLDLAVLTSHIVSRNSLEYPWRETYDLIMGNPPWGYRFSASKLRTYAHTYQTAGTRESFAMFLELGFALLKPLGNLAFVLPQAILNVQLHEAVRRLLLSQSKISKIYLLGNQFGQVHTPSLTLSVRKQAPSTSHRIEVIDGERVFSIDQARFSTNDFAIFNVHSSPRQQAILDTMRTTPGVQYLKNNATFAMGIVTGNNKKLVRSTQPSGGEVVLRGSDLGKYNYSPSQNFIVFEATTFQQVAPEALYRAPEKLLYRFISEALVVAYDNRQRLTLNSANLVIPRLRGYSMKYVLAVLNSRCSQFYFTYSFASVKVLRRHLESIPIPPCAPQCQAAVIRYVDRLLVTQDSQTRLALYDRMDTMIAGLFGLNEGERTLISNSIPQNLMLSR